MNTTSLPYLALLEIRGKDAGVFLQGQLTQNVLNLNENITLFDIIG